MNQIFLERKNLIDMNPFPNTKCLKIEISARKNQTVYKVYDRFSGERIGIFSKRLGQWQYINSTFLRLNADELYELARVCKWLKENETDTQNTISKNPA